MKIKLNENQSCDMVKLSKLLPHLSMSSSLTSLTIHGEFTDDDMVVINDHINSKTKDEYLSEIHRQELIKNAIRAVEDKLNEEAQNLGYNSIYTAVSYADEPAVLKFQTEGQALRAWRSLVWEYCFQLLEDYDAGIIEQPTIGEILSGIPQFQLN